MIRVDVEAPIIIPTSVIAIRIIVLLWVRTGRGNGEDANQMSKMQKS